MTLSVPLRNPSARSLAVEPGAEAASLFRRSLVLNRLESRAEVLNAAVSAGRTSLEFVEDGSVTAHVGAHGKTVPAVALPSLLDRAGSGRPFLVKIDVEGYETELLSILANHPLCSGSCAAIELHPQGFNGIGDPARCLDMLREGPSIEIVRLGGAPLESINPADFSQIEAHWR